MNCAICATVGDYLDIIKFVFNFAANYLFDYVFECHHSDDFVVAVFNQKQMTTRLGKSAERSIEG